MQQYAPFPVELDEIVNLLEYRPNWTFRLKDMERDHSGTHSGAAGGLTLVVYAYVHDAYHQEALRPVLHYFPVPAATFNRASWERWVFERIREIETHESSEYFKLGDRRPFAPTHGPGDNPYTVVQYASEEQRRTSFRGKLNE